MCCCTQSPEAPIIFTIGNGGSLTPLNGTNLYLNPDLKYLKYYIQKNGFGTLVEGTHYERASTGGIILLNSLVFTTNEIYTIIFYI